jgi:uncharacterized membrane protein
MSMANSWLVALHFVAVVFWLGALLVLTRMLAFHAGQEGEAAAGLARLEKRLYFGMSLPMGILAVLTGLLMLHGVAGQFDGVGAAFSYYLKPKIGESPSYWYVTFHVKLVAVVLLILHDAWLGRQVSRMAEGSRGARWSLGVITGLTFAACGLVLVWLSLTALGVGPAGHIARGAAVALGAGGLWLGWRLAWRPGKARFVLAHAGVAALAVLIIVAIKARPLVILA